VAGWGSGPWGSTPWGAGVTFTPAELAQGALTSFIIYAGDMFEATFSIPLLNDDFLKTVENWVLSGSVTGNIPVTKILSGKSFVTNVVYLSTSRFQVGEVITLVVNPVLYTQIGGVISATANSAALLARRTKVDSMISSRPSLYNMSNDATLRHVLTAIGYQDDLIGGNR